MLSIIILNFNTRELLQENIKCVEDNVKDLEHEIILVDNGSTDGSVDFVMENYKGIKIVENDRNAGCSYGRNRGILLSSGEYVLTIDSDTFLMSNCIPVLLNEISTSQNVGAIGCKLLNRDGTLQYSAKRFPTISSEFFNIFFFSKLFPGSNYSQLIRVSDGNTSEVDWISGALMMFRRDAIFKVGLFDERYFYGGEDADICYRLKKNGYKILYTTKCSAIHLGGGTTKKIMKDIFNAPFLGKVLFFERQYGKKYIYLIKIIGLLQSLSELIGFAFYYLFFPDKRERARFAIVERFQRLKNIFKKKDPS